MTAPSVTPLALRQWRAEWQGKVRVALNDANRSRKQWELATSAGASAATEWANAVLQEASLPFLELGALQPLSRDLLPRATLSLRERADEARGELVAAVASSSAAAALLEGAASSLEAGIATIPLPVPVFATLGLPAIAGCFRRAADAQTQELERIRKRAVPAADAAVGEWRRAEEKRARQARAKTSSSNRSSSSSSSSSEALERLRSKLTVVIAAWKLQALLGPGAPPPPESGGRRGGGGGGSGGRALPVGAAGAGVAAELASVAAEMEGF